MVIDFDKLERLSIFAGYKGFIDMVLKFSLPILGTSLVVGLACLLAIDILPPYFGYLVMGLGLFFVIVYPYIKQTAKKKEIEENLHFFITYAGTIATMKISRGMLFKRVAEKKVFGEISNVFEKILYFAKGWNLGFAHSCRRMTNRVPSQIMSDFLDRFAIVMDFGQNLEVFLYDEQKAIMDDFSVEYKKSLEHIKLLQEMFIAISISASFILGIVLLAPLLMDMSIEVVMQFAVFGIFMLDLGLVVAIKAFIPSDKLFLGFKDKNPAQKSIRFWFWISVFMSVTTFVLLITMSNLKFIFAFATALIPMVYPGMLAIKEEEILIRRNKQFPVYARVLGSAIEVRNGGIISALKSTQVHDFGVLNQMSIHLHRRLRLGCNKYKSWYYFAVESGSNIIFHFSRIFSESVYLGGNANKIGQIVSKNMLDLLSLRKLRNQLAQGLRGAFYGSLIGLVSTMYVTASISQMLINLFSKPAGLEDQIFSFINAIVPQAQNINFDKVLLYIAILIIFHAGITSWIMKLIDGGTGYSALIDFVIMVWIGAVLSWILPDVVGNFLPSFSGIWGS